MKVLDHEHEYSPTFVCSAITGTVHRPCLTAGCYALTLDNPPEVEAEYDVATEHFDTLIDRLTEVRDSLTYGIDTTAAWGPETRRYIDFTINYLTANRDDITETLIGVEL